MRRAALSVQDVDEDRRRSSLSNSTNSFQRFSPDIAAGDLLNFTPLQDASHVNGRCPRATPRRGREAFPTIASLLTDAGIPVGAFGGMNVAAPRARGFALPGPRDSAAAPRAPGRARGRHAGRFLRRPRLERRPRSRSRANSPRSASTTACNAAVRHCSTGYSTMSFARTCANTALSDLFQTAPRTTSICIGATWNRLRRSTRPRSSLLAARGDPL
jgi:hypothetical protein